MYVYCMCIRMREGEGGEREREASIVTVQGKIMSNEIKTMSVSSKRLQ